MNVNKFERDVQLPPRSAVGFGEWHCCGLPSPGMSGSSQIISCWENPMARLAQEGQREEK